MKQLKSSFNTNAASSLPPDFMNVYYQIRSSQLDRSVKGLKEHFCKNSASSGVLYSPAVQAKRKDTPTKKAPKRPGEWAPRRGGVGGSSQDRGTTPSPGEILLPTRPATRTNPSSSVSLIIPNPPMTVHIPGKQEVRSLCDRCYSVNGCNVAFLQEAKVCCGSIFRTSGFTVDRKSRAALRLYQNYGC